MFDVWIALSLGVIGFFMRKLDFPAAPVILAIILAPMIENALRQSLGISRGDMSIFFTRPISAGLLILAAASLAVSIDGRVRESAKTRRLLESASSED